MISFGEVSIDDAERILKWRTSSRVTKFMNTDVEFNLDNQRQWLRSCYEKEHYYHWIIKVEGKPAGLLNICDYDPVNKTSSWGFYIGEDDSVGYGAFIPPMLYNFLFGEVGVKPPRIPEPVRSRGWGIVSHGIQPAGCGPTTHGADGGCSGAASPRSFA